MTAKEMCIQNPIVKGQYGEATNPIFEVFYLDNAHGVIADFSGNPHTSSKKHAAATPKGRAAASFIKSFR